MTNPRGKKKLPGLGERHRNRNATQGLVIDTVGASEGGPQTREEETTITPLHLKPEGDEELEDNKTQVPNQFSPYCFSPSKPIVQNTHFASTFHTPIDNISAETSYRSKVQCSVWFPTLFSSEELSVTPE